MSPVLGNYCFVIYISLLLKFLFALVIFKINYTLSFQRHYLFYTEIKLYRKELDRINPFDPFTFFPCKLLGNELQNHRISFVEKLFKLLPTKTSLCCYVIYHIKIDTLTESSANAKQTQSSANAKYYLPRAVEQREAYTILC